MTLELWICLTAVMKFGDSVSISQLEHWLHGAKSAKTAQGKRKVFSHRQVESQQAPPANGGTGYWCGKRQAIQLLWEATLFIFQSSWHETGIASTDDLGPVTAPFPWWPLSLTASPQHPRIFKTTRFSACSASYGSKRGLIYSEIPIQFVLWHMGAPLLWLHLPCSRHSNS